MKRFYSVAVLSMLSVFGLLFLMNCAGSFTEMATSESEIIKSHKEKINPGLTWKTAMEDIESVKGKVVKWDGWLVRIWDDKIQIFGRGREEFVNNFIVELNHPLPKEVGISEMTQTISVGRAAWVVGKIIDKQVYVTRDGVNITVPVLKGIMISKDNDRDFKNPVWVAEE